MLTQRAPALEEERYSMEWYRHVKHLLARREMEGKGEEQAEAEGDRKGGKREE